ncbi:MAG: hypothetical protein HXY35_10260 [Chloroflexi bacterium]|nr:hypothetical protein [Chloroflexota bacterium]
MVTKKLSMLGRMLVFGVTVIALLVTSAGGIHTVRAGSDEGAPLPAIGNTAIVFVSRQIPSEGSVYYQSGGSMPGVMPYSRFHVASPGKLIVREANGTLRVLVDGSNPTAASLNLIDVNAPDVSYDATKIVFAGLVNGSYSRGTMSNPGAWRLYVINVDGTGLRQLTFSDRNINLSQFGGIASSFSRYDDTDPAWLPDGRVVFSSTRYPSFGMYGASRTSNLYVVNADGTNLHRITSERNGADRPIVDPLTGRIVYSRWWRNLRVATNDMGTIPDPRFPGGYIMKDGLCAINHSGADCFEPGGKFNMERNSWHLASINPDGTGLAQFAGRSNTTFHGALVNHAYGGSFAPDGSFYANFFPMTNGTEASGFGGIRHYDRGPNGYTHVIGITTRDESVQQFVRTNPNSYGVYVGNYAGEPEVLPDGSLVISWAQDTRQDYGLYTINADGSGLTLLYDNPGTTELRARAIRVRPVPPIIPDKVTTVASELPPLAQGPYNKDGNFTFDALNVYFNAPVDVDILNALPVGSANTIRFYIDHQRTQQTGSIEALDWPILLDEVLIDPDGSVTASSPANVPLFEQIRTKPQSGYTVPLVGSNALSMELPGAAHVAGENFGRPGQVMRCVGCHAGHTMIPVPSNPADAQWTNLATGATVTVSSTGGGSSKGINDRRVKLNVSGAGPRYWVSQSGSPTTQWVQLTFPVPVTVRTVRLYNPASSNSNIKVLDATVRLFSDTAATVEVASKNSGALTDTGTNVNFNEVLTRVVRIQFNSVNGNAAALGEVEVIARAEADTTTSVPTSTPTVTFTPTITGTPATETPTSTPLVSETPTNVPTSEASPTSTPTTGVGPTSTFTPLPSATTTSVAPSNTPTVIPTNTSASTPTATGSPIPSATATNTVIVPTLPSVPGTLNVTALKSTKGKTNGSIPSLGLLQQKGKADDPAAYVTFQTPNSAYLGYQSFFLPADVSPSSVTSMTLEVNYKAPKPSAQVWTLSIYDWKSKKWVKLGDTKNILNSTEWLAYSLKVPNFQRYISSGKEIRIQLKSNNANGDLKVDYEVIKITNGVPPTATFTSTITPSPTPIQ